MQRRLVVRESGEIPYGHIVDGTHYVHGHKRYNDLDELTSYAAGLYRKDYGLPPDGPGYIVYAEEDTPEEAERCSRCGRRVWLVIEVVRGGRGKL